jgi:hypothetical protein
MFDPTQPCEYHARKDCKACKALNFALKAEQKGMSTMVNTQLDKAIVHEAAGE